MGAAEGIAPLGKQYGGGEHIGRDDLVEQASKFAIGQLDAVLILRAYCGSYSQVRNGCLYRCDNDI
jgi:hypothetical protein